MIPAGFLESTLYFLNKIQIIWKVFRLFIISLHYLFIVLPPIVSSWNSINSTQNSASDCFPTTTLFFPSAILEWSLPCDQSKRTSFLKFLCSSLTPSLRTSQTIEYHSDLLLWNFTLTIQQSLDAQLDCKFFLLFFFLLLLFRYFVFVWSF